MQDPYDALNKFVYIYIDLYTPEGKIILKIYEPITYLRIYIYACTDIWKVKYFCK